MELLTEKYNEKIIGVLGCFDRILITGTIPKICFSQGITSYFLRNNIRIFDYMKFVQPLSDKIRQNAEQIAKENGIEIEFIRKTHI